MLRRLTLLLAALLTACAGGAPAPTPSPTPTPGELIARAAAATQAAASLRFSIAIAGRPVQTDPSGLFRLIGVDGAIQPPDGGLASLKVRSAVGVAELRTVSLAGRQYLTNPVTGQWQCAEPGQVLDPGLLLDPQRGVAALLAAGVEQPELVGAEEVDGRAALHLRGRLAAGRLAEASGGLLGAGPVTVDLWSAADGGQIVQLVIVEGAADGGEPTTWTIRLTGYGEPVDLRAPIVC